VVQVPGAGHHRHLQAVTRVLNPVLYAVRLHPDDGYAKDSFRDLPTSRSRGPFRPSLGRSRASWLRLRRLIFSFVKVGGDAQFAPLSVALQPLQVVLFGRIQGGPTQNQRDFGRGAGAAG
jgi:hypothetical protein